VIITSICRGSPPFNLFLLFSLSRNIQSISVVFIYIIRHLLSFPLTDIDKINVLFLLCLFGFLIILALKHVQISLLFIFSSQRDIIKIELVLKTVKKLIHFFSSLQTMLDDLIYVGFHRLAVLLVKNDFLSPKLNDLLHFLCIDFVWVILIAPGVVESPLLHDEMINFEFSSSSFYNLFFYRSLSYESVNYHFSLLSDSMRSINGL
jgi:hypothetical protein